jgi:hypothetical protein
VGGRGNSQIFPTERPRANAGIFGRLATVTATRRTTKIINEEVINTMQQQRSDDADDDAGGTGDNNNADPCGDSNDSSKLSRKVETFLTMLDYSGLGATAFVVPPLPAPKPFKQENLFEQPGQEPEMWLTDYCDIAVTRSEQKSDVRMAGVSAEIAAIRGIIQNQQLAIEGLLACVRLLNAQVQRLQDKEATSRPLSDLGTATTRAWHHFRKERFGNKGLG